MSGRLSGNLTMQDLAGARGQKIRSTPGIATVTFLVLASMGPYLLPGVRFEQAVIYPLFLWAVVSGGLGRGYGPRLRSVVMVWSLYVAIVVFGLIFPVLNSTPYGSGSSWASGVDNAVLPIAVISTTVSAYNRGGEPNRLLSRALKVLVLVMCVNAGAAVAQYLGLANWAAWTGGGGVESVSTRAAMQGRFSGFANQPAEAGLLYALAGLGCVHVYRQRIAVLSASLVMLFVGGILTVSKIFAVGVILIAVSLLTNLRRSWWRVALLAAVATWPLAMVFNGVLPRWSGVDQIQRQVSEANVDLLSAITAGRYSEAGGPLRDVWNAVLHSSPVTGYGPRGLDIPYDSGWTEALVVAGLIGVVLQVVVFFVLFAAFWEPSADRTMRRFVLLLATLLLAASLGVPAFTANRVATDVWTVLTLVLLCLGSDSGKPLVRSSNGRPRKPLQLC